MQLQSLNGKTRDDAWQLVARNVQSEGLRKHMLAVEAAMRAYARLYGEDEDYWGTLGLIHDWDWEVHPTAEEHPSKGVESLREMGWPEEFLRSILSLRRRCAARSWFENPISTLTFSGIGSNDWTKSTSMRPCRTQSEESPMGVKIKKYKGTWYVFIDHQGHRKAKKIGTRQAAETVKREIEARLALGDLGFLSQDNPNTPSFAEYADSWTKHHASRHVKPSTVYF